MRLSATLIAAALVLLSATAAHASTATTSDGNLRYTAFAGEANNVTFSRVTGNTFRVTELAAVIQAGGGCTQESPNVVTCTTGNGRPVIARLGDLDDIGRSTTSRSTQIFGEGGNDTLTGASGRDTLSGGDGNDTLNGGSGGDTLNGDGGNDTLNGGGSGDRLRGGDGNDLLRGGSAGDAMSGGRGDDTFAEDAVTNGADAVFGDAGFDTADYSARTANLHIDLNAVRDDGQAGERDDVRVDRVIAGSGKDVLLGDDHGADDLNGGPGDDIIDGRRGNDRVDAGPGLDQIGARDLSPDLITCGEGPDSVAADRLDTTAADCEKVRRDASVTIALAERAAFPTVVLRVTCPRSAFKGCGGRVIIRTLKKVRTQRGPRVLTVGVRRFGTPAGTERLIGVRIRAAAKPFLGRAGLVVRAAVSGFDGAGPARRDAIRFRLLP
jgi:hypothetical protein